MKQQAPQDRNGVSLKVGDKVTPVPPTDHPESPVGVIVEFLAVGGAMVYFPRSGAEVWAEKDLAKVEDPPPFTWPEKPSSTGGGDPLP